MLDNALDQFLKEGDFQYLIYSTADVIVHKFVSNFI